MSVKHSLDPVTPTSTRLIKSHFSPWLAPLVYPLACWLVLPLYFRNIVIKGQENLPTDGPIILAPTHRSRWDALLMGYIAGRWATGRDLRFMVTADEVKGLQGWFIRRLGGFPVNPRQPAIASLRHGVDLLHEEQTLVIFPEGGIFRDPYLHPLKPGLARLALQAESLKPGLNAKIVPISMHYGDPWVKWGCGVEIRIGEALSVAQYTGKSAKENSKALTQALTQSLTELGHLEMAMSDRSSATIQVEDLALPRSH